MAQAIRNQYVLDVDIKRGMTARTPTFRKGDNAVLIFKVFDDGKEYLLSNIKKAEVWHETPSGYVIKSDAYLTNYEGKLVIIHYYDEDNMVETGITKTMLVMYEGSYAVSVQPFPVVIYSDMQDKVSSFIGLIKDLQDKINNLVLDLNQTIKQSEKGKPNGVATLDASGKIPQSQLPPQIEAYIKHMSETVWKNQVHGLRIDKDGIMQYDTGNNNWQNVGFAPTAIGGGSTVPQLLDVNITKSNSIATLTYVGVPTVQLQKWAIGDRTKTYFVTSGTTFTGNTIPLTQLGIHTLYYKDSNGVEYVKTFNVVVGDLTAPTISVSVNNGDVTVNISGNTSVKKWAKGKQTIGYFQSQGATFTGNTFSVTEVGWYTIYYKTTAGAEYIYEFEVNYAQLNGNLPIVTYSDITNSASDKKYRAFIVGIKDSRVTMAKFTGHNTSIGSGSYTYVYEENGYYFANGMTGFIDVTSTNHDMTVEFMDNSYNVYGTAVHKCRANYNYFIVNNQYVSLTRIKNSTTNYTLPTTIEGLPVLDAGCAFFTNEFNATYDKWNTKNLTVPSQILCGGRFANTTIYSTTTIESVRIENTNFKFNIPSTFSILAQNKTGGIVIYVPANSETYNTVTSKIGSQGHQVQTF